MSKKSTTPKAAKTTKATKPAKAAKAKPATTPAKADKPMSGLDAAAKVLADAKEPMNAKAMVETMLASGLWKTGGKTPQATIYAAIIREIAAKSKDARFKKTDRGLFTVNG
ncbi:MAG: winged helix-turn-helix domain-containing protein [Phycisphaeraceae bacterium]|nr:winged helix-turn-helix domain-containing protein [Phycisphaeraceae bacterium]